jgi:hypothetical protein
MAGHTLLRCPFCGGSAEIVQFGEIDADYNWQVLCRHMGCRGGAELEVGHRSWEEAVERWNRRASDPAVSDLVRQRDALREALERAALSLENQQDTIACWGAYASAYFQRKHDLEGDIESVRVAANAARAALSATPARAAESLGASASPTGLSVADAPAIPGAHYDGRSDVLHLYAQPLWHAEAYIAGTRESLSALAAAIQRALLLGGVAELDTFANDGEGYTVHVVAMDEADMDRVPPPYTEEYASGTSSNEPQFGPWSVVAEAYRARDRSAKHQDAQRLGPEGVEPGPQGAPNQDPGTPTAPNGAGGDA